MEEQNAGELLLPPRVPVKTEQFFDVSLEGGRNQRVSTPSPRTRRRSPRTDAHVKQVQIRSEAINANDFFEYILNANLVGAIQVLDLQPGFAQSKEETTGYTALHYLAQVFDKHDSRQVRALMLKLLEKGADTNALDKTGSTPLHHAAASSADMFGYLLKPDQLYEDPQREVTLNLLGANGNAKDHDGRTPFHIAASFNVVSLFEDDYLGYLGEKDPVTGEPGSVDIPDDNGETPMQVAAEFGCHEIVRKLYEEGAAPSYVDEKNKKSTQQNILHYAVQKPRRRTDYTGTEVVVDNVQIAGKVKVIEFLATELNSDDMMALLTDNDNTFRETPLEMAYQFGEKKIIDKCEAIAKTYIDEFAANVAPKQNEKHTRMSDWAAHLKNEFTVGATNKSSRMANVRTACFADQTKYLQTKIASATTETDVKEALNEYQKNCLGLIDSQTKYRIFCTIMLTLFLALAGLLAGFAIAAGVGQTSIILGAVEKAVLAGGDMLRLTAIASQLEFTAEMAAGVGAVVTGLITASACVWGFFGTNRAIKGVAEEQEKQWHESESVTLL